MSSGSIHTYRNVDAGTASSRTVVIRLYQTAEEQLKKAADELRQGQPGTEALLRAQAVVGGLMSALDMNAGEIAQQLLKLYLFVLDRIQTAQTEAQDPGLEAASQVLAQLREGFEGMPADEVRKNARPLATSSVGISFKG